MLKKYTKSLLDNILPPRCIITGEEMAGDSLVSPKAWAALDFINDPMCACCGLPFAFDVEEKTLCTACVTELPPFKSARAALIYNDNSRDLVLGFKHADKTHGVKSLTPWIARAGQDMLSTSDYLVPVPLHYTRLVKRRYNQAALIAKELGKLTNTPILIDGLKRTRATPTQGHLSYKDRYKNVRKAFTVNPKHVAKLDDKNIVLIDDVYTTGATVRECTKVLLKHGTKAVNVLTLARVVRFE